MNAFWAMAYDQEILLATLKPTKQKLRQVYLLINEVMYWTAKQRTYNGLWGGYQIIISFDLLDIYISCMYYRYMFDLFIF